MQISALQPQPVKAPQNHLPRQLPPNNLPKDDFTPGPMSRPESEDLATRRKILKACDAAGGVLGTTALAFLPGATMNAAAHHLGYTSSLSGFTAVATFAGGLAVGLYYASTKDPDATEKSIKLAGYLGMAGALAQAAAIAPTTIAVVAGVTAVAVAGAEVYSRSQRP